MKLLVANWKMNGDLQKLETLTNQYVAKFNDSDVKTIVCPPYIYLSNISKIISRSRLSLGAQNCSHKTSGPSTGQISVSMLQEFDVKYVIIGHSECRQNGETSELLHDKLTHVLDAGLIPIFCVGEKIDDRKNNSYLKVVDDQLKIINRCANRLIIAYEPVWAIGTQLIPTNQEIDEVVTFIKSKYKCEALYGGSVSSANISQLTDISNLDGFLVGGASLDENEFTCIEKAMRA